MEMEKADYDAQCQAEAEAEGQMMDEMEAERQAMDSHKKWRLEFVCPEVTVKIIKEYIESLKVMENKEVKLRRI